MFFRGIDIENGYILISINQSECGDELCRKIKVFLKNVLAKVIDMWLNSRALTKRQASECTDKDLEKQHEIKKVKFRVDNPNLKRYSKQAF